MIQNYQKPNGIWRLTRWFIAITVLNQERKLREDDEIPQFSTSTKNRISFPNQEVVRSLNYSANTTRTDISYAVNVLSRHQINPTEQDWNMAKRVFGYLVGPKTLTLTYTGASGQMEAYCDASFADCKGSLKTCGFVIRLFGDSVALEDS